jgi:hypothetical protein
LLRGRYDDDDDDDDDGDNGDGSDGDTHHVKLLATRGL